MMSRSIRVTSVSLNPAIDQTARISRFTAGRVNRVEWETSDAGGKGVNVASFLADAGIRSAVTGFFGNGNLEPFAELFTRKGIADHGIRLAGRTRVNVKITDPVLDQVTDINFPGLAPGAEDLSELTRVIDALGRESDWVVLTGSVPAEVPPDIYATLIERLKAQDVQVLLDASGPPFAEALKRGPDIIKPNIDELGELIGQSLKGPEDVLEAARGLIEYGIGLVAVSMGPQGAVFVEGAEAVHAVPPSIEVKSTVGAGDAMVAGILTGTARGLDLAGQARLATAFSLGALGEIGPHLPPLTVIDDFVTRVEIKRLD